MGKVIAGIPKVARVLASLLSIVASVATLFQVATMSQSNNSNETIYILYGVVTLVLLITMINYILLYHRLKQKTDFIMLLAREGHIHTVRMILMRDKFQIHTQAISGKSADFHFIISPSDDGASDVIFRHNFAVKFRAGKEVCFEPWVFGENDAPPEQCHVILQDGFGSAIAGKLNATPEPLEKDYKDYSVNNGIYSLSWNIGTKPDVRTRQLQLSYTRKHSYLWDRDEIFVIYPQSFMPGIKQALFSIRFEEALFEIEHITIEELKGRRSKPRPALTKSLISKTYESKPFRVSQDAVYIVTIHHANSV